MEIDLQAPQTKSNAVAQRIEREILSGKLAPGSRLPAMRTIAKNISVSLRVVQSAFEILDRKGLVDCRLGSGTFVCNRPATSSNQESKIIYFLIPHPIHITLQLESSIVERRLIYGGSLAGQGNLIQTVPVSRKLEADLENIDWVALNQIPEGARVYVGGFWFRELFPFLAERKVKAIMRMDQYGHLEYPKAFDHCLNCGWYRFGVDRMSATEQAVQYLLGLGRRRVGMIKQYKNEPLHPYRLGMISAYEKFGIEFKEELYCETGRIYGNISSEDEMIDFWNRSRFDALIIGQADMFKAVYNSLTKTLGLRIPDDVALMSFSDHPDYLETEVPVSAIDFPWVQIGQELVKCFNREQFTPGETVFNASIIERESTRKGAGSFVNHNFMPELPVENQADCYQAST